MSCEGHIARKSLSKNEDREVEVTPQTVGKLCLWRKDAWLAVRNSYLAPHQMCSVCRMNMHE